MFGRLENGTAEARLVMLVPNDRLPIVSASAFPALFFERLPAVLFIVILAQFMYISRLPIRLNQDHAKSASPAGESCGMVNCQLEWRGQLPWKDWITVQEFPLS
jgi:hypothetical protein